jgi:hypothetical protein
MVSPRVELLACAGRRRPGQICTTASTTASKDILRRTGAAILLDLAAVVEQRAQDYR